MLGTRLVASTSDSVGPWLAASDVQKDKRRSSRIEFGDGRSAEDSDEDRHVGLTVLWLHILLCQLVCLALGLLLLWEYGEAVPRVTPGKRAMH